MFQSFEDIIETLSLKVFFFNLTMIVPRGKSLRTEENVTT